MEIRSSGHGMADRFSVVRNISRFHFVSLTNKEASICLSRHDYMACGCYLEGMKMGVATATAMRVNAEPSTSSRPSLSRRKDVSQTGALAILADGDARQ